MKILAIRGENLASLSKPFAVELAQPPLSQHGLFAMTGPTGSGKSTLLDALCVALFDTMPRLDNGAGVLVGKAGDGEENWVRSSDVRSILRRGSGHAWAEVDFLGIDRRCYRVKWAVQRARRKAEGRLQPQTITLQDLENGQVLGGVKRETLALIQEKLGLDFDQFRRSIFLSQGEFAAFIKSGASQRGELLEQITGDRIYGRLSVAAHERALLEKQHLDEVTSRMGEIVPFSPAERLEWEARRAGVMAELAAVQQEQQGAQRWLAWQDRATELAGAVAIALEQREQAHGQWLQAEERRRNLAGLLEVQPLRGVVAVYDQAVQAVAEADAALANQREALAKAVAVVALAREEQARQQQRRQGQQQHWEAVQRLLGTAQALDARLQEAQKALASSRKQQQREGEQLAANETSLLKTGAEIQQVVATVAQVQGWLQGHHHLAPIVAQWPRWSGEIERFHQFMARKAVLDGEMGRATQEQTRLLAAREKGIGEQERLRLELVTLDETAATLHTQLTELNLPELAVQREVAVQRRYELQQAMGVVRELVAKQTELTDHGRERERCTAEVAAGGQQRLAALAVRDRLLLEQDPLMVALAQARNAMHQDVVALRESLQAGQPCPVCGAESHPYAHGTVGLEHQWRLQEEQVTLVRQQITQASEEVARLEGRIGWATERVAALLREEAVKAAAVQTLQGQWRALGEKLSLTSGPDGEGVQALARALAEVEALLGQLMTQERQGREILKQQEELRRRRQKIATAAEKQQQEVQQIGEKLHHMGQRLMALTTEGETLHRGSQEILATLAGPFAHHEDWQGALSRDPQGWREVLQTLVSSWQQQETALTEAGNRQQKLLQIQDNVTAEIQGCRQRLATLMGEVVGQQDYLNQVMAERQGVFQGKPWAEVEAVERQAWAGVVQEAEASDRRVIQGEKEVAQWQTAVRHWLVLGEQRREYLVAAEQSLGLALKDRPLAGVRQLLAVDGGFLEDEKLALEALTVAHRESHLLWEERSRQVQQHESQPPAGERPADLAACLADLETRRLALNETLVSTNTRLQEDDHRRQRSAILQQEYERVRQVWELWEGVRELIGSANGAKFRTYAQGLTLDFLLVQANGHLVELAPRYRLERTPQSELEIQVVDQEMGDDVRAVASLSGGETFLVSLALALGLSSLAAHRIRVESLFIDEGFGALDGDTLDVVLASLDALQSTGRQVGVISHVPALTERIGAQIRVVPQGGGRSRVRVG